MIKTRLNRLGLGREAAQGLTRRAETTLMMTFCCDAAQDEGDARICISTRSPQYSLITISFDDHSNLIS